MEERIYGTNEQYSAFYRAKNIGDNFEKGKAMKSLAEKGFAPAEYWMATTYLNSCAKKYGFKSDTTMAFNEHPFEHTPDYITGLKWAKKAAAHGYVFAYRKVAVCYSLGNGTRQNYNEALKWHFKAADEYLYVDYDDKTAVLADTYAYISEVYTDMRDFANAEKYSRLALKTDSRSDLAQLSVKYLEAAKRY